MPKYLYLEVFGIAAMSATLDMVFHLGFQSVIATCLAYGVLTLASRIAFYKALAAGSVRRVSAGGTRPAYAVAPNTKAAFLVKRYIRVNLW